MSRMKQIIAKLNLKFWSNSCFRQLPYLTLILINGRFIRYRCRLFLKFQIEREEGRKDQGRLRVTRLKNSKMMKSMKLFNKWNMPKVRQITNHSKSQHISIRSMKRNFILRPIQSPINNRIRNIRANLRKVSLLINTIKKSKMIINSYSSKIKLKQETFYNQGMAAEKA